MYLLPYDILIRIQIQRWQASHKGENTGKAPEASLRVTGPGLAVVFLSKARLRLSVIFIASLAVRLISIYASGDACTTSHHVALRNL